MRLSRAIFTEGVYESATLNVIGVALLFLSPGLLVCTLVEWGSGSSHQEMALLGTTCLTLVIGMSLRTITSIADDSMEKPKAVFSVVAWSWVSCALVGVMPYLLGDVFAWSHFGNALFESISGFSCTGSTVLEDIESNGRGILLWRQMTQWYGGMGMIVLGVTVLPNLGVGGLKLMAAEAPGHKSDKLKAKSIDTAKSLWVIYFGITAVITFALWILPNISFYDAIAHGFSTVATGGFSTYNASIGHFNSYLAELVIVVGMFICAMNFNLQFIFLRGQGENKANRGKIKVFTDSSEWKLYVKITLLTVFGVFLLNWLLDSAPVGIAFRDSLFNVVALASSTGFGNVRPNGIGDFVLWGTATQLVLLFLMAVGGTVGSTSGGMKVLRMQIGLKALRRELKKLQHGKLVFPIKLGKTPVEDSIVASALGFISLFISFVIGGTLVATVCGGDDFVSSLSGAISAMSNMGPALGDAGPTSNFLEFSRIGRAALAVLMVVGRLEIYAVILMFIAPADRLKIRKQT
ncbi:MAG: TrkH family potassium uptake protein [Acidimicrobiales bacterium]|jgi:trk system potassium uptake protein TrkH|nr:TrkH family potassium uptake protein [Acidimicrobiales bacterium]MDP6298709.1 TrkH family potassium uptake protein [Acidimicrobiales bacterium]HJM27846.1 TrkH family potassium uptake protein [Acidimicrobiales bacterium]